MSSVYEDFVVGEYREFGIPSDAHLEPKGAATYLELVVEAGIRPADTDIDALVDAIIDEQAWQAAQTLVGD